MAKKFICRLSIIILLVGLFHLAFAEKDFSRKSKIIRVHGGKIINIALDTNPTTGFSWRLVSVSDKNVLEFVKKEFSFAKAGVVGSGGVENWSFRTLKSGQAVIVLEYSRVWEKNIPAAKREEFSIFVK